MIEWLERKIIIINIKKKTKTKTERKYFYSKISLIFYVITLFTLSYQAEYSVISQLIGIILVFVFLMESIRLREAKFFFPIPLIYFIIFLLVLLASSIFSSGGYSILLTVFQLILLTFIIINIIVLTGHVWPLVIGILLGTLILNYQIWSGFGYTFNLNGLRMSSDIINANLYSMYLSMGILASIYILTLLSSEKFQIGKQRSIFIKVVLIMIIIFYSYLIINFSGSKKGLLGISLIFSAYLLFKIKQANMYLKILYIFTIPFLIMLIPNLLKNTIGFNRLTTTDNSLNIRAEMISDGIKLWSKKPLFGWGVDKYREVSNYGTYSHNNYIELLSNNGLIGFIIYYTIFISILFIIVKLYFTVNESKKAILFWCALVMSIILFWDIGLVSYYSKSNWLMISMVIGLLMSIKIDIKNNNEYY